ncbi:MAG TPA: prepilin-type N-terminal cleavage/methylation domain-containing protein [Gemmatimonadaceae bacterium]
MRPPPFRRRAFTLVELLVACFVLGTGVLALASTSVAVARLTGDAARAGVAAERGQARMEGMRAARCSAASGTVLSSGIAEWWAAVPAPTGQALSDSVRYIEGAHHDLRTDTLSSAAWCP